MYKPEFETIKCISILDALEYAQNVSGITDLKDTIWKDLCGYDFVRNDVICKVWVPDWAFATEEEIMENPFEAQRYEENKHLYKCWREFCKIFEIETDEFYIDICW